MALSSNAMYPYGLREVKVKAQSGTTLISAPAAQTLKFTERVNTAELRGNDKVVVANTVVEAVEFEFDSGGYPLDMIALMTGRTLTAAGTGTSETNTMKIEAGDTFPWITIYGKSVGDAGDDIHVKIWKAKLTSGVEGEFKDQSFFVSKLKGIAVSDGTNGITSIVHNETATALPTS